MSKVTDYLEKSLEQTVIEIADTKAILSKLTSQQNKCQQAIKNEYKKIGMGTVYVIESEGMEYYKIGITDGKVTKRLTQLQTGNSNKLIELFSIKCTNFVQVEKKVHLALKEFNIRNEWFELDNKQYEMTINLIKDFADV